LGSLISISPAGKSTRAANWVEKAIDQRYLVIPLQLALTALQASAVQSSVARLGVNDEPAGGGLLSYLPPTGAPPPQGTGPDTTQNPTSRRRIAASGWSREPLVISRNQSLIAGPRYQGSEPED
jgi:hypothetical protein